jgi:hypothetical protein
MADETLIQNLVGGNAIVHRTIGLADQTGPRTWGIWLWHSGEAPAIAKDKTSVAGAMKIGSWHLALSAWLKPETSRQTMPNAKC